MAKLSWKPLEKTHPIFTKGFSTYSPHLLRKESNLTKLLQRKKSYNQRTNQQRPNTQET